MKVGQKVKWTSSNKTKQGEVVAIVEPLDHPVSVFKRENLKVKGFSFNSYGGGIRRTTETYLIALHEPDKKRVKVRKLYWPIVSLLKQIENYE